MVNIDYTFGNVNVLLGQVDRDDAADHSYFEISGSLGQIAGLDASLTITGTFDESDEAIAVAKALDINPQDSIVIGFSKAFDL